jgi:16S rRNA (cytidine1402-2'-O)-methyltransferase
VPEEHDARGVLYVVATPIGNLEDLSTRALATLRDCEVVACEDTRRTRALLARHGLTKRLLSCHKFNESARAGPILQVLGRGGRVALVTDGGTPAISDPGALLVRRARDAGHSIVVVPGPSALTALLSGSGFPSGPFTFAGFLPARAGERRRSLAALAGEPRPIIFFESPRRIRETLQDLLEVFGDRPLCLGRELTKVHEEFLDGTVSTVRGALAGGEVRGEIAFVVDGAATAPPRPADPGGAPEEEVRSLIASGVERREALRRVARQRGLSRAELYRALMRDRGAGR